MAKNKIGKRAKSQKSGDAEGSDAEDSDADGYAKTQKTEESRLIRQKSHTILKIVGGEVRDSY